MSDIVISFVIPAYNVSDTIFRCLDSIYALPMQEADFEVIVIDDCSTDNSVELVKEYSKNYSNLVLLCQTKNNRQGAARNRGVAVAKGEYVCFVDSDDTVADGILSAIHMAKEQQTDMIAFHYAIADKRGQISSEKEHLSFSRGQLFSGIEMQSRHPYWCSGPVAYLYDKEFLERVNYPFAEGVLFEDSDFVNVHLFYAKRMMYSDDCGYIVHYNADSTTHTMSYKHLCDYAFLGTRMLNFYEGLEDKSTQYAKGILEGGSYNIMKAFRKLSRLKSGSDVCSFYDRFDAHYDRKKLFKYREPAYCWNRWTRICLKYRGLASTLVVIAISVFKTGNGMKFFLKRLLYNKEFKS